MLNYQKNNQDNIENNKYFENVLELKLEIN